MALKVGELYAALSLTKDQFDKGLASAHSGAKKWASNVGGTFKSAGKLIAAGLAIGIAAIALIAKESMGNAVEQERATARVKAAFKGQAGAVEEWVAASSKAWGINDDTLEISVAKYGDWAKNVGMTQKEAIAGSEAMAKRAAEISLATGKDFETVFDGLFKGQQGMTRGLKEYGITVDKQALMNEALKQGWLKEGEAMDAATAARARGSLIMQQSSQFTAIAGDMADSLALKERQMGATMDTVMDAIGAIVLNLATAIMPTLAGAFQAFADWLVANMPTIQAIAETVLGAIGKAFDAVGAAIKWLVDNIFPPLKEAFNWLTNDGKNLEPVLAAIAAVIMVAVVPAIVSMVVAIGPLLLAIGAIIAIVAVLTKAWMEDWGGIRTTLTKVWQAIEPIFRTVVQWLSDNIPGALRILGNIFGSVFGAIAAVVKTYIDIVLNVIKVAGEVFTNFGNAMAPVVNAITKAWGPLSSFFGKLWSGITSGIRGAINAIIDAINSMIRALNGIQIHFGGGPGGIGKFDWDGFNIGYLPHLASGTPNFKGGWAMVGENGPELARLPQGSQVFSAGQTRGMIGAGTPGPLIGEQHIYGVQPGDVERETRRAFRRQALDWALEGRT